MLPMSNRDNRDVELGGARSLYISLINIASVPVLVLAVAVPEMLPTPANPHKKPPLVSILAPSSAVTVDILPPLTLPMPAAGLSSVVLHRHSMPPTLRSQEKPIHLQRMPAIAGRVPMNEL